MENKGKSLDRYLSRLDVWSMAIGIIGAYRAALRILLTMAEAQVYQKLTTENL